MQRELKNDPVDRSKLKLLRESEDDALPLIATLFTDVQQAAASELTKRIETISTTLGGVAAVATYASGRIAAALGGEELDVSDVQLISALTSRAAAADTEDLRNSGRIAKAADDVKRATGNTPAPSVLVMALETSMIGISGEEKATYTPGVYVITVIPNVSDHTLRHELVHATQPAPAEHGPLLCRRDIIEGATDALALEAGSDPYDLSYAAEAAAVLSIAEALSRPRSDWLRELNSTSTPEETIGAAFGVDATAGCNLFLDAKEAAEGRDKEFEARIAAARDAVSGRVP